MDFQEYVIQIDFNDRIGLGYEIFEVFKQHNLNLLGMEAEADKGMVIKLQASKLMINSVIAKLRKIDNIYSIQLKNYMPYEEREQKLKTILDSVSDGIIAVNSNGEISHINRVACEVINCCDEDPVDKPVDLVFKEIPLGKVLETGKPYHLKEIKTVKNNRKFHFLTSGVPIKNGKGQIIGGVATIKDYSYVVEIMSKVEKKGKFSSFKDVIYQSTTMKKVVDMAKTVAKSNSTVMLRGESGTGKELFAKAIHLESNRTAAPFIPINCAALPDTLLESELFGYEEGAFTGALKGGKKGLFEQAMNGTVFLDEIGEISHKVQVKLLRVLQENTIRRVGGEKEISVDVRIIAATHRNLEDMIKRGEFREDLYYRLNVIPILIPPLSERREDIPLIIQHLVRKICFKLNKPFVTLTKDAIYFLMNQPWPGNVRQLENVLERVINMTSGEIVAEDFLDWTNLSFSAGKNVNMDKDSIFINLSLLNTHISLKEIVKEVEKQILGEVLKNYPSSREAGKILGVSNTTILNKKNAYGL